MSPIVTERGERKWIEVFRRRIGFGGAPALLISALDLTERWAWLDAAKRLIGRHGTPSSDDVRSALGGIPGVREGDGRNREEHGRVLRALTRRQRQVLDLIAGGRSNKQIALQLGITEGTVKLHVFTLMRSFKVPNRTLLALIAHDPRR
ncbi:MAG: response regulator transcription factor [Alphaproteobacteria bacterium]|nr:response regulator transcription factor [Alphaproteobacteria bacterium]